MFASPRLPWELIERIIGHCGDDPELLRNFSLSCPQLRPRSLCLMVADVKLKKREQIFAFRDFLGTHPHLRQLVASIRTWPDTSAPFHILHILPNVTKITICGDPIGRGSSLPPPVLASYRTSATRVQILHLSTITFPTLQEFCRVLQAFTGMRELCCSDVDASSATGSSSNLRLNKWRLSQRLLLTTLSVSIIRRCSYTLTSLGLFTVRQRIVPCDSQAFDEICSLQGGELILGSG